MKQHKDQLTILGTGAAVKKKKKWLSHSGMEGARTCPRCFWLRYREGIYQPEGFASRLPGRFDTLMKAYFQEHRIQGKLPPFFEGKLDGKLEQPFQETYFHTVDDNYGFMGKLDECLVTPEGLHVPVDFKTTSSDPRGRATHEAYERQIDAYTFLLAANRKKPAGYGYLIFVYPAEIMSWEAGFPMVTEIVRVDAHPEKTEQRIGRAIEILSGTVPAPGEDCQFCAWHQKVAPFNS